MSIEFFNKRREVLPYITTSIETIREKHNLGKRLCTLYSNPPQETLTSDIPCPKCGGKISYTILEYTGFTYGSCANTQCINWRE